MTTTSKVIVLFKSDTAKETVEAAANEIIANGGVVGHRYETTIVGFSASIPDSLLATFASNVAIESIEADGEVSVLFNKSIMKK